MPRISLTILATLLCLSAVYYLKVPSSRNGEEIESEETESELSSPTAGIKKFFKRAPAATSGSKNGAKNYDPGIQRSKVSQENYSERPAESIANDSYTSYVANQNSGNSNPIQQGFGNYNQGGGGSFDYGGGDSVASFSPTAPTKKATDESVVFRSPAATPSETGAGTVKKAASNDEESHSSSSPSTILPNTCSPSIVGGSFNAPIKVTLSCSRPSTIKYCLQEDTGSGCCDPESAGSNYPVAGIPIGKKNATYCLSYVGSSDLGTSDVYDNSYTFNSALPDLQVGTPKTYYQTTELVGKSHVTSLDFGKPGYHIGQVNLRTHNPTSENLSCEEIVTNYVAMPLPTPVNLLSLLDVSGDSPSDEIIIPFRADQMDYGENFITSFIQNTNTVVPLYSCSTAKVTLMDFEYFDTNVALSDVANNNVIEFSGSLTPFGFFEAAADVNRTPAGESSNIQAGVKLEEGLFEIFY